MRPKILVADDDEISRQVHGALLADCGADLLEARDGHEALAVARQHDCCLALLDIQMPGMNGYRVAEAMRRDPRTRHLPIVFVSGVLHHDEPLSLDQQLGHADMFIEKPVNPDLLRQVVRMVLRLRLMSAGRALRGASGA